MKKLILFVLAAVLVGLLGTALCEDAPELTGAWRAARLVSGENDFDLTGANAAKLGIILTLNADETFELTAYAKNEIKRYSGEYDLFEGDRLLLYASDGTSPSEYRFEGDLLVLTETTAAQDTTVYFEKCDNAPVLGYWRSVSVNTGVGEIDIDGSKSIGMSLYFRPDGSCTGIILSNGKSSVRDMAYVAASEAITLIEPNTLSTFIYTLDGDTMICRFISADSGASTVYTMIR